MAVPPWNGKVHINSCVHKAQGENSRYGERCITIFGTVPNAEVWCGSYAVCDDIVQRVQHTDVRSGSECAVRRIIFPGKLGEVAGNVCLRAELIIFAGTKIEFIKGGGRFQTCRPARKCGKIDVSNTAVLYGKPIGVVQGRVIVNCILCRSAVEPFDVFRKGARAVGFDSSSMASQPLL